MKNIAVLGVGSLIGEELIEILQQRDYPAADSYFMSDDNDSVETVVFKGREFDVLRDYDTFLGRVDIVFCCLDKVGARAAISKFKGKAAVIDCSRAFNFAGGVDLVIPEVNPETLKAGNPVIANPGPLTIQLLTILFPLHKKHELRHLHVTAFESISDLGNDALAELSYEYEYLAVGADVSKADDSFFPCTIGSNLIPQVGDFTGNGDTEEEVMFGKEVKTILKTDDVRIGMTAIWVPLRRGNSMTVWAGFGDDVSVNEARKLLKKSPGIKVMERDEEYPMPENVIGKDDVFIGRIRQDSVFENGLAFWITTDNLRKGSALNAVQIAELLL